MAQAHDAMWWVGYWLGLIGGSLSVGALLGLIPLVLGRCLGLVKFGLAAFLATVVAGLAMGLIGAVPASLVLAGSIYLRWRQTRNTTVESTRMNVDP